MGAAKTEVEKGALGLLLLLGGTGVTPEPRGNHNVMHAERCNLKSPPQNSSYTATS